MSLEDFGAYDVPTAPQPSAAQNCKKSWTKLRATVRETRKSIARLAANVPSNFQFHTTEDSDGRRRTELYFLGDLYKSQESTLLKVNIPDEPLPALHHHETNGDLGDVQLESGEFDFSASYPTDQEANNRPTEPVYMTTPVFGSQPSPTGGAVPMSKEEQLLRERKRLGRYGITSYESCLERGLFVFPAHNSLYKCIDKPGISSVPTEIPTSVEGARLDPKICPCNSDLVAFINDNDIWLTSLGSGHEIRLTHASKGDVRLEDNPLSAGVPSFVIQEEFSRYTGYWWAPLSHTRADGKKVFHILYEEVDESEVEIVSIFSPTSQDSTEQYRYPKAGSPNATSALRLLELTVSFCTSTNEVSDMQVSDLPMRCALKEMCPWAEYLTRAGWTPDGEFIYAVVLDRAQMRQAVMLISPSSFYNSGDARPAPKIYCIYEETSDVWINDNDILYFFPQTSASHISFLYASEMTGFRHLYLVTSELEGSRQGQEIGQGDGAVSYIQCRVESQVAVTSGPWAVLQRELWVDEQRGLVFFMGLKDSPLETHLYVTSYKSPWPPLRLTQIGFSHAIQLSKDFSQFVSVFSSLSSPPQSAVYRLDLHTAGVGCTKMGNLTGKVPCSEYRPPSLFTYTSGAGGHTCYGLYLLPHNVEPGKRYPTVLFVYGGPCVQMVTNSFKGQKFLSLHTLAADGYAVVVIDGRGSTNRGLQFEGYLKNQMGTVEISDQVEGLSWLARHTHFIDTTRVAIYGWSYGGYLSLMGLTQRSDIFKVCIAGAPVVNWELYDTGYTERYIDQPQNNKEVYTRGSVLSYIEALPEDETRLLLVHSLKDENVHFQHSTALINQLVKCCKPYQLLTYPNERHGIRDYKANEHYRTTVLKFLQDYL